MAYPAPNIQTSGASFAQLQAGGLSAILEKIIAVNAPAESAPTSAPTLAASGSGGTLPAATYYVVLTETNGYGETTASPVSASQAVTLGQNLVITPPTLKTGNVGRNYYIGTSSTGPFTLAATGQTGSTYSVTAPLPTNSYAVTPPTVNTTAFSWVDANGNTINAIYSNIRAFKDSNFDKVYKAAAWSLDTWLRGDPVSFPTIIQQWHQAHAAVQALSQAMTDIGTLIDANAGTIRQTSTGIGQYTATRTWP